MKTIYFTVAVSLISAGLFATNRKAATQKSVLDKMPVAQSSGDPIPDCILFPPCPGDPQPTQSGGGN